MMMSNSFNEALKKINALLASDYTDAQLERVKNDIRGMALYDEITDNECYTLLEMLPNVSEGITITDEELEDYKQKEEEEKEANTPKGFNTDDSVLYKLYHTSEDDYEEESPVEEGGFNSSTELADLYDKFADDEPAEVEETEDVPSPFSSTSYDDDFDDNFDESEEYEESDTEIDNNSFDNSYDYPEEDEEDEEESDDNFCQSNQGFNSSDDDLNFFYDDDDDYDEGEEDSFEEDDDIFPEEYDEDFYEDDEDEEY